MITVKILFAAPDRDLLYVSKELLSGRGHTVVTAFDGPQAQTLLASSPDAAVIDLSLPRTDPYALVTAAADAGVKVTAITLRIDAALLKRGLPVRSYLCFPFTPAELFGCVESAKERKTEICGLDVSKLRLCAAEEAVLADPALDKTGIYIDSLNHKLASAGAGARIEYIMNEGYRLVKTNG